MTKQPDTSSARLQVLRGIALLGARSTPERVAAQVPGAPEAITALEAEGLVVRDSEGVLRAPAGELRAAIRAC